MIMNVTKKSVHAFLERAGALERGFGHLYLLQTKTPVSPIYTDKYELFIGVNLQVYI